MTGQADHSAAAILEQTLALCPRHSRSAIIRNTFLSGPV